MGEWSQQQRPRGIEQWWGTATRGTQQPTHISAHGPWKTHTHDYTYTHTDISAHTQATHTTHLYYTCTHIFVSVHLYRLNTYCKSLFVIINPLIYACFLSSLSLCFSLHVCASSSLKFQTTITFHISISGDSLTTMPLSRSPQLCPTYQSLQNPVRTLYFLSVWHLPYITISSSVWTRAMGDWAGVASDSSLNLFWLCPRLLTHTYKYNKCQRGKAGGFTCCERWKKRKEREKVTEANRESARKKRRGCERKRRNEKKMENKTTGEVGEKRRGIKPLECFFAPVGQKVTAWRG